MSGVWDRVLTFLGFEEVVEEEYEEESERAAVNTGPSPVSRARRSREVAAPEPERPARYGALVPIAGGARGQNHARVTVWHPTAFDEVQTLVDRLREGHQIVVNLEGVDRQLTGRIINFLSGSVYALGGSMYRVSSHVVMFLPAGVSVDAAGGDEVDWWSEGENED
ncbi:MAG: cell division protein SepF [Clostridia bacterium]|nr:cell division protein SepF [Clostridia bacterium]